MKIDKAIELMRVERECVMRNDDVHCNRDCVNCDLCDTLEKTSDIIEAYGIAIEKMEDSMRTMPRMGWLLVLAAYIPSTVFTIATCHFIDCGNWISTVVFFILVILTLPRYGVK